MGGKPVSVVSVYTAVMALSMLKTEDELARPSPTRPELAADDEPQGCVFRVVELPDGSVEERVLPLTLELLLNPQEGDKVSQSDFHFTLLGSLVDRLRRWLERTPGVGVFSDLIFDWGLVGLRNPSPDVAVVEGLQSPRKAISEEIKGRFEVASMRGASPPGDRGRLARARPTAQQGPEAQPRHLRSSGHRGVSHRPPDSAGLRRRRSNCWASTWPARRLTRRFRPIREGRILSRTTGLLFWSDPEDRRIEVFDQATGRRLLTSEEEEARADAETERANAEAERADAEAERADGAEREIARLRALLER